MTVAHNSSFDAPLSAAMLGSSPPTPVTLDADLDGYTAEDEAHPYDMSAPEVEGGGEEEEGWADPTGQS
jgi:hypothetical protein